MAIDYLSKHAKKGGSYPVQVTFRDGNKDTILAANIKELYWTLTDENGSVVNSREEIEIVTPANPQLIVLNGADLGLLSGETALELQRRICFEGVYDSDTYGNDLSFVVDVAFILDSVVSNTYST